MRKLAVWNVSDWSDLQADCDKLRTLWIYNDFDNRAFNALRNLTKLSDVTFFDVSPSKISGLEKLSNLRNLRIFSQKGNEIASNYLQYLDKLETLSLFALDAHLTDLSGIEKLDIDGPLYLTGYQDEVLDVASLAKLAENSKISTLSLENVTFENISFITKMSELDYLTIRYGASDLGYYILDEEQLIEDIKTKNPNDVTLYGDFFVDLGRHYLTSDTVSVSASDSSRILSYLLSDESKNDNVNKYYTRDEQYNFEGFDYDWDNLENVQTGAVLIDNTSNQLITLDHKGYLGKRKIEGYVASYAKFFFCWETYGEDEMNAPVTIPDEKLNEYLLNNYDTENKGYLTRNDLEQITSLDLSGLGISDLTGLEYATNLTDLDISDNIIINITIIIQLSKLEKLNASNNEIEDISSISSCNNLKEVDFSYNKIEDVSSVSSCTVLESIDLSHNNISDISSLSGASSNLQNIDLSSNEINESDETSSSVIEGLRNRGIIINITIIIIGDFDGDGIITSFDAYRTLELSISLSITGTPTTEQLDWLDADKDGQITSFDAYIIFGYSIGIEN